MIKHACACARHHLATPRTTPRDNSTNQQIQLLTHNHNPNPLFFPAQQGANSNGQLGDGTTSPRSIPVAVVGLESASVDALAVSSSHSCALLSGGGGALCWGQNNYGQSTPNGAPIAYAPTAPTPPESTAAASDVFAEVSGAATGGASLQLKLRLKVERTCPP